MKTEVSSLTKRSNTAVKLASELTSITSGLFVFQNKVTPKGYHRNLFPCLLVSDDLVDFKFVCATYIAIIQAKQKNNLYTVQICGVGVHASGKKDGRLYE